MSVQVPFIWCSQWYNGITSPAGINYHYQNYSMYPMYYVCFSVSIFKCPYCLVAVFVQRPSHLHGLWGLGGDQIFDYVITIEKYLQM